MRWQMHIILYAGFDPHLPLKFSGVMLRWARLLPFLAWAIGPVSVRSTPWPALTYTTIPYSDVEALLLNILRLALGVIMSPIDTVLKNTHIENTYVLRCLLRADCISTPDHPCSIEARLAGNHGLL